MLVTPTLYGPDGRALAPSIVGLAKKSTTNPSAEDGAIRSAVQMCRGIDVPLPVIFGRRIIGYVEGKRAPDPRVTFRRVPEKQWCGFATYDQLIQALTAGQRLPCFFTKTATTAPVANNWYDLWPVGGNPQAGAFAGAASVAVQFLDTTAGALYTGGNVSTQTKHILSMAGVSSGGTPMLMLYDRVLTYEANIFNNTVNKVMTNTLPALRYVSAGQSGMKIMCTVQTLNGATAANLTQLRYTNQAGTTLQSMPTGTTVTFIPSATAPTATLGARVIAPSTSGATLPWGPFLPLAVGDSGAQLINDFTTTSANTGTFTFTLARPLFIVPIGTAGVISQLDGIYQVASLERIFDGGCMAFIMYFPAATATTFSGTLDVGWN
jgi:hypothetical protein